MKKESLLLIIVVLCFFSENVMGQTKNNKEFEKICEMYESKHTPSPKEQKVQKMIDKIVQLYGLTTIITAVHCNCNNVIPVIYNNINNKYLIFSEPPFRVFNLLILRNRKSPYYNLSWTTIAIITHQVGHLLNYHVNTFKYESSSYKERELNAGEFAGFILQKLGATLEQAQRTMKSPLLSEEGSHIYPPRKQRLDAIKKGWDKAYNASRNITTFWLSPDATHFSSNSPLQLEGNKNILPISLKVMTEASLQKADFQLRLNGQLKEGYKMPEGNLFGNELEYTYEQNIPLQAGNNKIELLVQGKASTPLYTYYSPIKPNLYVFTAGIEGRGLDYPDNDAKDMATLYKSQESYGLFAKVDIVSYTDEQASAYNIINQLEQYSKMYQTKNLSNKDILLIHISSHGFMKGNQFYLQGDDFETGKIRSTAVNYEVVKSILAEIPCKKIVFLDACHSGGAKADPQIINSEIKKLSKIKGTALITSSQADERSYEDPKWKNGAFTEAIIKGLNGRADSNNNGIITIGELFAYIERQVPAMVKKVKQEAQHPSLNLNELGADMPIFVIEK